MSIAPERNILVPGRGVLNLDAEAVNRAVSAHDERLRFGFNETNQDWVIYIKMPRDFNSYYYIEGEPVYPVLGFGSSIPLPDEAVSRLSRADTLAHGMNILERMNKENAKIEASYKDEADALTEEVAERIEHAIRKDGGTDKYGKVFFSSKEE